MMLVSVLLEILRRPTIGDVLAELMMFMAPLWIAVVVGVLVGWTWKPKWANLGREMLDCSSVPSNSSPAPPAASSSTVAAPSSVSASIPCLNSLKLQLPSCISWIGDDGIDKSLMAPTGDSDCRFVGFFIHQIIHLGFTKFFPFFSLFSQKNSNFLIRIAK